MLAAMTTKEIYLVTIKGDKSRPGLLSELTETIGPHHVTILDIGQSGGYTVDFTFHTGRLLCPPPLYHYMQSGLC